jgi:predicted MFS family arabinose efflux permease
LHARNTAPLGAGFRTLWTASAISTIGDGITLAAGPMIVASLTRNPAPVAIAAFSQQVPWLGVGNIAFCAAFADFVLYVREHLGLTDLGYGLLLTTFAIGGTLGTLSVGRIKQRWRASTLLRVGLFIEALTHAALGATTQVWIAAPVLILFGVHTMVWGSVASTLYQQRVPDELRGRVGSVRILFDLGGAAIGTIIGGLIAQYAGLTIPFWSAAAVMLVVAVCAWKPLGPARIE